MPTATVRQQQVFNVASQMPSLRSVTSWCDKSYRQHNDTWSPFHGLHWRNIKRMKIGSLWKGSASEAPDGLSGPTSCRHRLEHFIKSHHPEMMSGKMMIFLETRIAVRKVSSSRCSRIQLTSRRSLGSTSTTRGVSTLRSLIISKPLQESRGIET